MIIIRKGKLSMKIKKIIMTLTFALLMSIMVVGAEPEYDSADEIFPRTTIRLDEIPEVIDADT
jgi:hypothetical protein